MNTQARELALATQLFLARHAEALSSGDGARTLDACDGLLLALAETIPQELEAARAGRTSAPQLAALVLPDSWQREAWAHANLRKRAAECEGILLQLQLALRNLARGQGDAFRLVALITAARATLRGLDQAFALWADAMEGVGVKEVLAPPHAGLRAAREALLAEAPDAAAPALRRALASVLAPFPATPPALARDLPAIEAALDAGTRDPVTGWALVDAIEALAHAASMLPRGS